MPAFVATTARAGEAPLVAELDALGITARATGRGAVLFEGPLAMAYTVCLWSRVASRVLMPLARIDATSADALYEGVKGIDWVDHIGPGRSIAVTAVGTNPALRNSHFTVLKVKDGIVDRIRGDRGARPIIDPHQPDVRVFVYVDGRQASVNLDLSGEPLHRRGIGREGGAAPLKETLAAAILWLADWPALAADGAALVDPMCGSGTFLTEGAGMALNRAPGLTRERWGFEGWSQHDAELWKTLYDEAWEAQREELPCLIMGADRDGRQLARARANLERAALEDAVPIVRQDWAHLEPPTDVRDEVPFGLVVVNPPYGERLDGGDLVALYASLGDRLRRNWLGWTAWILAGSPQLAKRIGLRPKQRIEIRNGPLDCRLVEVPIATRPVERDLADQ